MADYNTNFYSFLARQQDGTFRVDNTQSLSFTLSDQNSDNTFTNNEYIVVTMSGGFIYSGNFVGSSNDGIVLQVQSSYLLFSNTQPVENSVFAASSAPFAVCYLSGTKLLTSNGEIAIEDVREGDLLVTRMGGLRPVRWVGRQRLAGFGALGQEAILFLPGSLGEGMPHRPLRVSPNHSMLVGERLVLARDLVNGITVTREERRDAWEYVQVEFDTHDLVLADGAWSESFADAAGLRDHFDNADEFRQRFPDHVAPETVRLCLPRPASGPGFEAALRTVAMRAAAVAVPGPLKGVVETIDAHGVVTGWAQDADHELLPVPLEAVLHGKVIGTALACRPRWDMAVLGVAGGRAAFRLETGRTLSRADMAALVLRRAGDGALLGGGEAAGRGEEATLDALKGHLDLVATSGRVEGWAMDKAQPERAAQLEVLLDGNVLGTALACRHRADLAKIAADGRLAFFFDCPRALTSAEAQRLSVRRAGDGAILPDSKTRREGAADVLAELTADG